MTLNCLTGTTEHSPAKTTQPRRQNSPRLARAPHIGQYRGSTMAAALDLSTQSRSGKSTQRNRKKSDYFEAQQDKIASHNLILKNNLEFDAAIASTCDEFGCYSLTKPCFEVLVDWRLGVQLRAFWQSHGLLEPFRVKQRAITVSRVRVVCYMHVS